MRPTHGPSSSRVLLDGRISNTAQVHSNGKVRAKTDFDFIVLLTMYDGRMGLSKRIQRELREKFGDHVMNNVIPRSIRMAEAPSHGQPGIIFSPKNRAAQEYQKLAKDLMENFLAETVLTRLAS